LLIEHLQTDPIVLETKQPSAFQLLPSLSSGTKIRQQSFYSEDTPGLGADCCRNGSTDFDGAVLQAAGVRAFN
jgi:hypothetical protein